MNGNDLIEYEEANMERLVEGFLVEFEELWNQYIQEQYINDEADQADAHYEQKKDDDALAKYENEVSKE